MVTSYEREFLVVCMCAEWCGTCRDYRTLFDGLAQRYPDVEFRWVDIEEEAGFEDWEIENFPTLIIQRDEAVLFFGPALPYESVLTKMLDRYLAESPAETLLNIKNQSSLMEIQNSRNYRQLLTRQHS